MTIRASIKSGFFVLVLSLMCVSCAMAGYKVAKGERSGIINRLFRCECGKVFLIHVDGDTISIVDANPPEPAPKEPSVKEFKL